MFNMTGGRPVSARDMGINPNAFHADLQKGKAAADASASTGFRSGFLGSKGKAGAAAADSSAKAAAAQAEAASKSYHHPLGKGDQRPIKAVSSHPINGAVDSEPSSTRMDPISPDESDKDDEDYDEDPNDGGNDYEDSDDDHPAPWQPGPKVRHLSYLTNLHVCNVCKTGRVVRR